MAKPASGRARGKAARRSRAEWVSEVAAWKRSGQTARDYARLHGISPATLLWWSSRGGAPATSPRSVVVTAVLPRGGRGARAGRSNRAFLPVQVATPTEDQPRLEVEIVLAGDRRVRVTGALTLLQLARLVDAVEGGGAC